MIFASFIAQFRERLAQHAEYRRKVDEINALSTSDLVDMRADRAEMLHQAYREVYGERTP